MMYCPYDLRVARLPVFQKERNGEEPIIASIEKRPKEKEDVVKCLEPSVFLKRNQQMRKVLPSDWVFVWKHFRNNVLYYPFDNSSVGDAYYYLHPLLCSCQIKHKVDPLDIEEIEREFEKAFPSHLRDVTQGVKKVLICLCHRVTDVDSVPSDYRIQRMSTGWYLRSSSLGEDCGVVLLDQEEMGLAFNAMDDEQVAHQLGSYYNSAIALHAANIAAPGDELQATTQYIDVLRQITVADEGPSSPQKKKIKKPRNPKTIKDYSDYKLWKMENTPREDEARKELQRRLEEKGISIYTKLDGRPKAMKTMKNDLAKLKTKS
eukprot:gb/GECG01009036.1/.p1 GENE.gb/GECG01009036.1/~~gb/GECG01009036.1/.p1  ORF type:complete len:319 (+),score=44.56 gb/GECG01009036.1/:1-957(+)